MAGDPFTGTIFRWLNAVAADASLPPAAFKLGYIISQYINRKSRIAWPSHETLACAMGLAENESSTRQIRRLLKSLVDAGYVLTV